MMMMKMNLLTILWKVTTSKKAIEKPGPIESEDILWKVTTSKNVIEKPGPIESEDI